MSNDKLIEILSSEWPKLRDIYKIDWPYHMIGYYTLDNFIRWIEHEPQIKNLHFYCLNGDWSDGTFLIVDRYQLFINTTNSSIDRLTQAISLLDWSNGYKVSTFLNRHRPTLLHTIKCKKLIIEFDTKLSIYYLLKEKAITLNINCPSDLSIKPMRHEHVEYTYQVLQNQHDGQLFLLQRLIAWNPNVGIFNKDDKLLAWCFRVQAGGLGAFQVHENYRRQGLGTLVLKAISKKIAIELNQDIFACVSPENISSIKTFEKVGFINVGDTYWLRTYPLVPFKWTDQCK